MSNTPPVDSIQFDRLLDRLARDITDAAIYRKLQADINASIKEFSREFSQSQTFWTLCLQAYTEMAVQRLSRIYFENDKALSLARWLEAIRDNPQLFAHPLAPVSPAPEFIGADGCSVVEEDPLALKLEAWLQGIDEQPQLPAAPPDRVQLDRDIDTVRDNDPLVKKLVVLRSNVIAHINWKNTANNSKLDDRFALTFSEVDVLIGRAAAILNRYSVLFKRTSWTTVISGHDDFQAILEALRYDLQRRHAEIDEDLNRANRTASPGAGLRLRSFAISIALFIARRRRRFS